MNSRHTIIGGGIIGLMCAHYLSAAGFKVTVVDRVEPGDTDQTSYGNAGVLAFGSIMPLGDPSIIWQGLKMLTSKDSSLNIPWSYRLTLFPWMVRLLRESTHSRSNANARAIAELNRLSDSCWRDLIDSLSLQSFFRDTGWLKVFETDIAMQAMNSQLPFLEEFGFGYQKLTADEVHQLEPTLSPNIRHGFLQTQSQSIRQPDHLLKELKKQLSERDVEFLVADVQRLRTCEQGYEILGDGFSLKTKSLTVCCGAWSQRLLSTLNERFPLETERGYHLMFDYQSNLSRSVMHMEKHIVLTPMDDGLRMTSGVEMAGLDAAPDYDWIRRKVSIASDMLNGVSLSEKTHWIGFRPSIPDSNPVIGAHPNRPGLTLAFGHGHLGMTQSTATGYLLAQIIQGETPAIPITPYLPDRFL